MSSQDLKAEEVCQAVLLEECPELGNEDIVVGVHDWWGSLAVLVGRELAVAVQCKDMAVNIVQVQFSDVGRAGPDPTDVAIGQSLPEHDLAFANLQVPMDQVDSEFIFNAVGKDEL